MKESILEKRNMLNKMPAGINKPFILNRLSGLLLTFVLINLLLFSIEITPLKQASAANLPPDFQYSLITDTTTNPTVVRFAPDGKMFVAEKSGIIKIFNSISDVSSPVIFADLRTEVYNYWDRGLLGMVLDPNFPTNPYVYVLYTYDAPPGGTAPYWNDACPTPPGPNTDGCLASAHLSRLKAQGNPLTAVSEEVLISDWCAQFPSHTIGDLAFGADGALYVSGGDGANYTSIDYGQFGGSLSGDNSNPCGDPPGGINGSMTPPTARGGALRSQSLLRPAGEPVSLDGSLLRVNPATGNALPDNPGIANSNPSARRIIAHGLRNPFRFTVRPDGEIWIGDVGYNSWEEIDRIPDPTASVKNFGWPCYEGVDPQPGYQAANLTMCQNLYNSPGSVIPPYYTYYHATTVHNQLCSISTVPVAGNGISSSITGMAFYNSSIGDYPPSYDNALFFADYSRTCVWVMFKGSDGNPDPSTVTNFIDGVYAPVQVVIGPGGDLYTVGLIDGYISRMQYKAPTASIQANVYSGAGPLTVHFTGNYTTQPGRTLSYSWDFNGDGVFGESTDPNPTFTYTQPGTYKAWVRVTDSTGKWSNSVKVQITVNNTAPNPVISAPLNSLTWKVGQTINFAGSATDAQDGNLPASALSWTFLINHCPSTCHQHVVQTISGVSSGSFVAPDHDYPSTLEIRLTATDSGNLSSSTSVILNPQTVDLTINSNPPGLQIGLNSEEVATPFTRTLISGSAATVSAPWPQTLNGTMYTFDSWSDNLAQSHTFAANSSATYTANFLPCDALLVNNSTDAAAPGGTCQVTLRSALAAATSSSTVNFVGSLAPITLTAPLDIPAGVKLVSSCQSKKQITASSTNKLRLMGNNSLQGFDILLSVTPNQGGALEYAGKQIQFKTCNSIKVVPTG